ncbi:outer membrane protein assembly factor BamC [Methylomarinum vadi]|uniref:outer membrane protein assembly factor BamC n=1 Tax=Methylomarinum vadi TaxID=438855 RepID=UPI0004DF2143|nr:outer membrane protein assembly factor BamC [Methylomarinum vadi]
MTVKALLLACLLLAVSACSSGKKYRDTTKLETPPRLAIVEHAPGRTEVEEKQTKKSLADSVFLDDLENPTVLSIKKLFDRSWDLVGQALDKKGIEITDKNREQGVYYVKYDASIDSGSQIFGNVKIFIFEQEYAEAEYKLTVAWHETATEVRAEMINKDKAVNEDGEELGDGSPKLLKALYDTIINELAD